MNTTQRKTLNAILADPVSPSIRWSSIESLLTAIGCELVEGTGSRVTFARDGTMASFHRPHPGKEAKRYQIRDVREFLNRLGAKP